MSTQQRKGTRASTAKKKPEVHELKAAYILPKEAGDNLIQSLAELPMKYSQIITPILDMLQKTVRGDIKVSIDPNQHQPAPALGPTAEKPTAQHPAAKKPVARKAPAK